MHDVLAAEQPELAARENLRPVLEPDRQVDLAHVDLGARLRTVTEVVVNAGVLDLGREAEVDAEIVAREAIKPGHKMAIAAERLSPW